MPALNDLDVGAWRAAVEASG